MGNQTYTIDLDYDPRKADASLSAFRARVITQLTELASKQSKIELFKDLKGDSDKADQALQLIKKRSEELRTVLSKLGKDDVGFKQLTTEVKAVDKEFTAAARSANTVADRIKLLDLDLKKAGIDTSNLAAEQLALAGAFEKVRAASAAQTARGVLGVTGAAEAKAQIEKLTEAYNVLRTSGTASINELAKAKQNLIARTIEINTQQSLFAGQLRQVGVAMVGLVGSVTAYTAGLRSAVVAASQYQQGLASIASITTLNKRQLDELGQGVLTLAGRIGIDSVEAFKALYNIIGSGIPAENSLRVLEASSKAAVAGLTSIENAARITVQVLNAYQLQITQIDKVQDILFQTVRDGVISFEELSDKFGLVLPAARSAGVSLEELSAATVVLTRNGLNAPRAMVALEGAIKQLAAPTVEAAATMAELNISYNGFAGTIEQLSRLNLGPDLLRRLIPDVEGQRAIALLTSQVGLFRSSLEEAANAAGATAEAFNKLKDTPEQAYKRFTAEINNLQIASGKALLEGIMPLLNGVTSLIQSFNELPPALRGTVVVITAIGGAMGVAAIAARSLTPLMVPLAAGLAQTGAAGVIAAAGVNTLRGALTNLLPAAVAGALGYEFGKSWRENDAIIRSFGDALGRTIGYLSQGAGALFDFAAAAAKGDINGMKDAVARLSRNQAQYNEELGRSSVAVSGLEVEQNKLRAALEKSQKEVSAAGAKFRAAFTEIIEAVDKPLNEVNTRIGTTARQIEAAIGRIAASAAGLKEVFNAQSADTERALAAQTQAIELLVSKRELTEVESIKRLSDANTKANAERLKSLQEFSATALRAFEAESASRIALAQKTGVDTKKIEIEIAASRIALINDLSSKYSAYIGAAQRAEEGLRDKIKSIDGEIRKIRADQAEFQNRALAASSGDVLAYYDRQNRAEAALAAAQRTSGEERKQNLELAKTLANSLGQAVTDVSGREVDAARAASIASGIYTRATNLEIAALNEKKTVFAASAAQYAAAGVAAQGSFVDIKGQLDRLFPEATKKLTLAIETDQAQIDSKIADLQRDLLLQAPLVNLKLLVDTALADYETFKTSVERNKPQAEIQGRFDAFQQSYKEVTESLPLVQLTPDVSKVDTAFKAIGVAVDGFKAKKIELQSNVDEIANKLKALDDKALATKQLTIEVNYTYPNGKPAVGAQDAAAEANLPGLASGGLVGASMQNAMRSAAIARFANGGAVAQPMNWRNTAIGRATIAQFASGGFVGKVPGTGDKDDYLTYLQNGSFVLRKSAVRALGERGIPATAPFAQRGVAASGGTDYSLDGFIARVNDAPVFDRSSQMTAMFTKAQDLQNRNIAELRAKFPAGYIEANAEVFTRDKINRPRIEKVMAEYASASARQNSKSADSATGLAVEIANGMANPARGLTIDELQDLSQNQAAVNAAKARMDEEAKEAAEKEKAKNGDKPLPPKKAAGGAIDGGMMAYTMPGEIVFGPTDVQRIGLSNLMAMNEATTREKAAQLRAFAIGGIVNAPPMHVPTFGEQWARSIGPTIDRFNAGGAVNNATNNSTSNSVNFNPVLNVQASSDVDMRQLVRGIVPELMDTLRRSGISLGNKR